jgi:hypothetical protein
MSRPPLSNETGRSGFRQAGPSRLVHVAQHVDGPQQRGCGRHALEGEGRQKGRCPAPHAGIVLAQHLVGIKIFRTRQRLRFGNARAEAIPRDHRRDCVKEVPLALASRNQCGADARVKANLLIDGAAIGLESAGVPALGLAKHRADEPVKQIDRLVCQIGDQVERNSDQGRMTALTFIAGDMLNRSTAGLAGELGKAA